MNNENNNKEGFYTVEEILNRRKVKGKYEYLIKWKGYEDKNNTWESLDNLQNIISAIKKYDEIYELNYKKKPQKKQRKFLRRKRKNGGEKETNKSKNDLNMEQDGYPAPNIIIDNTIEKIIEITKEKGNLIASIQKKDINGNIINEKMKTSELKYKNPWILINFYESKIRFNKDGE